MYYRHLKPAKIYHVYSAVGTNCRRWLSYSHRHIYAMRSFARWRIVSRRSKSHYVCSPNIHIKCDIVTDPTADSTRLIQISARSAKWRKEQSMRNCGNHKKNHSQPLSRWALFIQCRSHIAAAIRKMFAFGLGDHMTRNESTP